MVCLLGIGIQVYLVVQYKNCSLDLVAPLSGERLALGDSQRLVCIDFAEGEDETHFDLFLVACMLSLERILSQAALVYTRAKFKLCNRLTTPK